LFAVESNRKAADALAVPPATEGTRRELAVVEAVILSVIAAAPVFAASFLTTLVPRNPQSDGVFAKPKQIRLPFVPENAVPLILPTVVATDPALVVASPVSAGILAAGRVPLLMLLALVASVVAEAAKATPPVFVTARAPVVVLRVPSPLTVTALAVPELTTTAPVPDGAGPTGPVAPVAPAPPLEFTVQ
jgi:hypothetical protein